MKRSIKNTFIVTTLLLFVVAFSAVYDLAAKDYQDKEKRLASRPKQ